MAIEPKSNKDGLQDSETSVALARKPPRGFLRLLLRLPAWLYRAHLGWLLGKRFLLLTHTGRKSGKSRRTVIEVIGHDPRDDTFFVCSGWGRTSDWYRNICRNPEVHITASRLRLRARAEVLDEAQAVKVLQQYGRRHPRAFKKISRLFLGEALQARAHNCRRMAQRMPVIAFRPRRSIDGRS